MITWRFQGPGFSMEIPWVCHGVLVDPASMDAKGNNDVLWRLLDAGAAATGLGKSCIFAVFLQEESGYWCYCSQSKLAISRPAAVPAGRGDKCEAPPDVMSLGPCFHVTRWTSPNENSRVFLDCDCQNSLGECQCADHLVSVKQCCWWLMAA